jgi:hypothetical protein
MSRLVFCYGLSLGLLLGVMMWGSINVASAEIRSSTLDKANAIVLCQDHYGVHSLSFTSDYIICKDNYRPSSTTGSSGEIYLISKELDKVTYFNYTFINWKDYKTKD